MSIYSEALMLVSRLRRVTVALLTVLGVFFVAFADPAGAAENVDTTQDVVFSVPYASLIVGSLIPFVVALLTKITASSAVKGTLAFLLAGLSAALTALIDNGGSLALADFIAAFFATATTAQVAFTMLYKPTQAIGKVANVAPTRGIG